MSLPASGRTWEEASSPAAVRLAQRFEAAWRDAALSGSGPGRGPGHGQDHGRPRDHPDPNDFLPDDPNLYPGARLALLRADLALRWEQGERIGAEWYQQHYPDLGAETLVALIYEEFCLREEDDEAPDRADYLTRFPELAEPLRRVLEIHDLVGSASATTASLAGADARAVVFPEAGQTIAGFYLVEELGRGAFARVFLAQERQLADRLVALKVSRSGSREPQTLARLQHTHIVPVYSSRTDPASGLHLLWMPYFGRLTLSRVLADLQDHRGSARTGADLVEALDRLGPKERPPHTRAAGRTALSRRSFPQAIAWWGARMAEALDHAHDRGVLHRDIKPSNVLVTSDGMPMLLDFNLAREPLAALDDAQGKPAALGGTLDYMAPEHLEALASGSPDQVDGRADIYALGIVLFESLTGTRPFRAPRDAISAAGLLCQAAAERRRAAPWLRTTHSEVPVALEVVVRRCLAPAPSDRYASAGELAADLQAVADDQPLPFSREPWPGRAARWLRRRRRPLAMASLVAVALTITALALHQRQVDQVRLQGNFVALFEQATASRDRGDFASAKDRFESAATLVDGHSGFVEMYRQARNQAKLAEQTGAKRAAADRLFAAAKPLRFRLIDFCGDLKSATAELLRVLQPFYVLKNPNWTTIPDLSLLDARRRDRLVGEVNELLFLWVVALDRSCDKATDAKAAAETAELARGYCDQAIVFAEPRGSPAGPWAALRARMAAWPDRAAPGAGDESRRAKESSALRCFQWGLLRTREGRGDDAVAWFRKAVRLEPGSYWYHFELAYTLDRHSPRMAALTDEALEHYATAAALDPEAPWVRFAYARLCRRHNAWDLALEELDRGWEKYTRLEPSAQDADLEWWVRIEFGVVHTAVGDIAAARRDYALLIDSGWTGPELRAARTNLAWLDAESGARGAARAAFDALLEEDPDDGTARFGRALLALNEGRTAEAEADLTEALDRNPIPLNRADLRANRAVARLLLGRAADAETDAAAAFQAQPTPGRRRLWIRTVLALPGLEELTLVDPAEIDRLPLRGPALTDSLDVAAGRLKSDAGRPTPAGLQALLNRSVLLAALGDPMARFEADRAVALAPLSAHVYLVRAQISRHQGRLRQARRDVERGLELDSDEPALWQLRGELKLAAADRPGALDDFDEAVRLGGLGAFGPRAQTHLALGHGEPALHDWTLALLVDPKDPRAFLGRARAFLALGRWDNARADLEQAAAWTDDWAALGWPILVGYLRCLPARPEQLPRVLDMARRALAPPRTGVAIHPVL
jgi:serine/threonine protein kinase/predicted Zn-dependent protease